MADEHVESSSTYNIDNYIANIYSIIYIFYSM